ncbi:MAG: LysR family transcriptional regulator, partial [Pseudomonadota bacterium]
MQIKDVSAFVKAAEAGNLHVAAERIGITQPALTKSIRRLETALEVQLFERTARGVALTPIGAVLYERSHTLELLVGDIRTEIADLKAGGGGLVRIGAVPAVVESAVAPMLARCMEDDGAMRFDIQV